MYLITMNNRIRKLFGMGLMMFFSFNIFAAQGIHAWEVPFKPHPKILIERRKVIRKTCNFDPKIIKHEIEYIASKL